MPFGNAGATHRLLPRQRTFKRRASWQVSTRACVNFRSKDGALRRSTSANERSTVPDCSSGPFSRALSECRKRTAAWD